jgi:lipoic acid synthetase
MVEVLIPDYHSEALEAVVAEKPDVIAHNIETVRRLTPFVRDARAGYGKSIAVLRNAKRLNKELRTKSSIMLGLGESAAEVLGAMRDLRSADVDMLAIGQYLRPSGRQVEVARYVAPAEFAELQRIAERMGFACASGPFVRSSFGAADLLDGCNAR